MKKSYFHRCFEDCNSYKMGVIAEIRSSEVLSLLARDSANTSTRHSDGHVLFTAYKTFPHAELT